jgi:hypothetical protein
MKISKLLRKMRFSEDAVYTFCELKQPAKAREAMRFHENKIVILSALCILVSQLIILGILWLI